MSHGSVACCEQWTLFSVQMLIILSPLYHSVILFLFCFLFFSSPHCLPSFTFFLLLRAPHPSEVNFSVTNTICPSPPYPLLCFAADVPQQSTSRNRGHLFLRHFVFKFRVCRACFLIIRGFHQLYWSCSIDV